MITHLSFTQFKGFECLASHLGAITISVFKIIFKYNDKCEFWITTLKKWALYGEISSSELWLEAILETY